MLGGLVSNLRIIYANLADQAVLSASSTAGGLGVANLRTERKGEPHRSVSTSVTFTLTWSAAQVLSGVAIPACNLTPTATMRVQAWDAEAGGVQLLDTGVVAACPGQTVTSADWGQPVTAALFSFAASKVATWFTETTGVRRLQIDLADSGNPAGFLDCSRLVVGRYWSPSKNASYGARFGFDEGSEVTRTDAGGICVDSSPLLESMSFSLDEMTMDDRTEISRITRIAGGHRPILVALVPEGADAGLIQETMIYGVRKLSLVSMLSPGIWQNNISIEGW